MLDTSFSPRPHYMHNGNWMLKEEVRREIIKRLGATYPEATGNGIYHAIQYLRQSFAMGLRDAEKIVNSINHKALNPGRHDIGVMLEPNEAEERGCNGCQLFKDYMIDLSKMDDK